MSDTQPEPVQHYRYTVFGPMTRGSHTFEVHAEGCRDCGQPKYRREERYKVEAPSAVAAALTIPDPELGYSEVDVKVYPCCASAPTGKLAPTEYELP